MGFIRGSAFVIISVVFFITLLLMNSMWVISSSLDYENIKQELVPVVKQTLKENINITSIIELQKYPKMQQYCKNMSEGEGYVFSVENYTFVVPCSELSNGTEAVIDSAIANFVHEQYYKEYSCDFWNCFDKETLPTFVVSQHSKDYWQSKLYLSILAAFVLVGLMFFLIEKKTNLPLVAGSLVILSSLLFAKLEIFITWMINWLLTSPINLDTFLKFFSIVFTKSYKVFLIMLIIGLALLAFGIILKFFSIGFKIEEFFSKFGSKANKEQEKPAEKSGKKGKK